MTDKLPMRFSIQFPEGQICAVVVGHGAREALATIWQADWREAALIGDARVLQIYGQEMADGLRPLARRVVIQDFPPGEKHKTRATKEMLEDKLLTQGLGRQACVVGLGGGISLDVAGFVAATYMRGIPYINIPTSLLAQVDAAVGGKTGVNTDHGKNLIGAFHQPAAVLIDSYFLGSLPAGEWGNGLAEMVKHAVIADPALFQWIEAHTRMLQRPGAIDAYPLRRCVEIKADIVQSDEREKSRRSVLNFGHTIGHALEHASEHQLEHGRAVAIGMVLEAQLARTLCGLPVEEVQRLRQLLLALQIDIKRPALPFDLLVPFFGVDKKKKEGVLRMALPTRIGEMADGDGDFTVVVPLDLVRQVWEEAA